MNTEFVKNCYKNTGFKFDILPEQWDKIQQKFYDKIKELSNGQDTIYVALDDRKSYYTIYGDKLLIEKALYEIEKGE